MQQATTLAQSLIKRFGQECALLVEGPQAHTITAEGVKPAGLVIFAANQPDCDGHTQFMDGLYMYTKMYDAPAVNQHSYAAPILKDVHVL